MHQVLGQITEFSLTEFNRHNLQVRSWYGVFGVSYCPASIRSGRQLIYSIIIYV